MHTCCALDAENFSRRRFLAGFVPAAASLILSRPSLSRADGDERGPILGSGAHRYEWVKGWGTLPEGMQFGNTHGCIVIDGQGRVFVNTDTENAVIIFDSSGKFLKSWGQTGSENGQFSGVRSIAIDAQGNVYVADAGNKRIQVFDGEGTFKSQISSIGTPQAICISRGATQYLYSAHSGDPDGMEDAAIFKVDLKGNVLGKFGSAGKLPKEFSLVNSIDCRNENELLVGELANWRVQKITLRAAK